MKQKERERETCICVDKEREGARETESKTVPNEACLNEYTIYICISVYVPHVYIYIYIYVHKYIYIHICVCIYSYLMYTPHIENESCMQTCIHSHLHDCLFKLAIGVGCTTRCCCGRQVVCGSPLCQGTSSGTCSLDQTKSRKERECASKRERERERERKREREREGLGDVGSLTLPACCVITEAP